MDSTQATTIYIYTVVSILFILIIIFRLERRSRNSRLVLQTTRVVRYYSRQNEPRALSDKATLYNVHDVFIQRQDAFKTGAIFSTHALEARPYFMFIIIKSVKLTACVHHTQTGKYLYYHIHTTKLKLLL